MSSIEERLGAWTGHFARRVQGVDGQTDRWQRGVELVVELVAGCDHAGVSVASKRQVHTAAATDEVVRCGDSWQYELSEGPCLETVREQHTVISQDLRADPPVAPVGARVVDGLGVLAMMSLLLYTERDTFGALNLYADAAHAWDHEQITVAHALAGHLAVAAADAREIDGRGQAMINRTVIGQAEGILMERFDIDGDHAFEYLRRISQDTNRKLTAVAEDLVNRRSLPDPGHRWG